MKLSNNFSTETPIYVYGYTDTMKRIEFYADSVDTANKKINTLEKMDIINVIDARN